MVKNFITALQFLTVVTVRRTHDVSESDLAKALPLFPLVGFLIGVVLVYADRVLVWLLPYSIAGALVVLAGVFLTRALHVDGLADTLDGLMGGHDRESRLRIMRDSRIGTAGVLGIVFLVLLKYLGLNSLAAADRATALLLAPTLARWSQTLMTFRMRYGRDEGMGRPFVGHLRRSGLAVASLITIAIAAFVHERWALVLVPAVVGFILAGRWYLVRRLGGVTGDTIGAMSEATEVLVFLFIIAMSGRG